MDYIAGVNNLCAKTKKKNIEERRKTKKIGGRYDNMKEQHKGREKSDKLKTHGLQLCGIT